MPIYILLGLLAATQAVHGQATVPAVGTPQGELCGTERENSTSYITYIADQRTNCWYWRCVGSSFTPTQCPLGSAVSDFYTAGSAKPCSVSFNPNNTRFYCPRNLLEYGIPDCVMQFMTHGVCKNGGTVAYSVRECWCECPEEWAGDAFCSTRSNSTLSTNKTCTLPERDFCSSSPCQNAATCTNTCTGYQCGCVKPYTYGTSCEHFDCEADSQCHNGGSCVRLEGLVQSRYASCQCLPGFSGIMCELILT